MAKKTQETMHIEELIKQWSIQEGIFRISILGDGGVGKTTILTKLIKEAEKMEKTPVIEKDERTYFLNIATWELSTKNKENIPDSLSKMTIQNFDLAGQSLNGCNPGELIPEVIFSRIDAFLFVFSVDNFESLEGISDWLAMLDNVAPEEKAINTPSKILIANKMDKEKNVDLNTVQKDLIGEKKPFQHFVKLSAKNNEGIDKLIEVLFSVFKERLNEITE